MLKNSELRNKLFTLSIAPVILCCALLWAAFIWLNTAKSQQYHQNTAHLIQSLFSVEAPNYQSALSEISSRAASLVNHGDFHNVVIFEGQKEPVSFGPPLLEPARNLLNTNNKYDCKNHFCHYRFTINLFKREHTVVASFHNANPAINGYKIVISLLLVGFASSLFIIFATYRFKEYLVDSIEKIRLNLSNLAQGNFNEAPPKQAGAIYNMLSEEMDSLTKELQEVKRNGTDSSLDELKETLETVEIQNIELDMARKNALNTSRVKSEFFANICHEIRTPLNGIIGFSELLHRTDLSSNQRGYLETIDDSAKNLLTVVNDILDFSRLEIGKLSLEYKPTRIRQVIEDAVKLHAPAAQEKRLRLLTIIDHDFPENLLGDPLRLKQVLNNLISNAIKFTRNGHILISVSKETESHSQLTLKFSVTDSGIGLSEDQKESLFEAFSRPSENNQARAEGTGLGLIIAKGIVDHMQGRIGVESEIDKGATFWFTASLGQQPRSKKSAGYLAQTLNQVNVLVCEDDPLSRNEITHYLRGWGAYVVEQADCKKVVATLADINQHHAIHLVILGVDPHNKEFNTNKLSKLVTTLNQDFLTTVLVIADFSDQQAIEPLLEGSDNKLTSRPLYCNQLHQTILDTLGNKRPENTGTGYPPAEPAKAPNTPSTLKSEKIRVLAVDDNQANLRLVLELLKELDAETVGVSNGPDVLLELDKAQFDMILMDVQMPTMDGVEVTQRVRALEVPPQRTPIIALTAHAVSEQKSKLIVAGMDDYLTKPVNENELRHVLQRWTKQKAKFTSPPPHACELPQEIAEPARDTATQPKKTEIEPPLVDLQLSLSLAKNKADLAKDMLEMMYNDLEEAREKLIPLAESKAFVELQEMVHKIHGGSCYCGIPKLKQLSETYDRKLESIVSKKAEAINVEQDMHNLSTLIDQLIAWRKRHDLAEFFGVPN